MKTTLRHRVPVDREGSNYTKNFGASFSYWVASWKYAIENFKFSTEVLSGLTVAAVAMPLNLALAVSCGLPPIAGLVAGAIGGMVAGIMGGAPLQVTGPAAALSVMVTAISAQYGVTGVALAAVMVGALQLIMFFLQMGKWIRKLPEAVVAGFTTGVGLKLLDQQIPQLLDVDHSVVELLRDLLDPHWLNNVHWLAVVSGLIVIFFVLSLSKYKKVPAAILGISLVTFISVYLNWNLKRVGEIPAALPTLQWPFVESEQVLGLFLLVLPLALLASVESLLSATAVDRMRPKNIPHDPNLELMGQGTANIVTGLFSGMPVSGVIVRSSVNVQAGAHTRIPAILHGAVLLFAPILASDQIRTIPVSALAGLLCVVGMRLIEFKVLLELFSHNKVHAIAFVFSALGVITGHLMAGLVTGVIIAFLPLVFSRKKNKRLSVSDLDPKHKSIRAIVPQASKKSEHVYGLRAGFHSYSHRDPDENWEGHIADQPIIHPSAFVHQNATIIGKVYLGPQAHVAAEAALRADEGAPFYVGANTNIQDGVVLHALKQKWVQVGKKKWAIHIGDNVSIAHQALIHGPCAIGNNSFVGFKAIVHDSVVGSRCFIGMGAIVVGVEIPDGKYVPHGALIDNAEKVQTLEDVSESHMHFNEDVVEVNQGLAVAYRVDPLPTENKPKDDFKFQIESF